MSSGPGLEPLSISSPARRRSASGAAEKRRKELLFWEDCPKELQFNRYIKSGYRAGLTKTQCLCSLFQYHNETGNIWVHFAPALLILAALLTGQLRTWPQAQFAFWEAILPTLCCLMGSVVYHTFMANHWSYHKYLTIDVCGVFSVLVFGAWSGIYWGMLCHPWVFRAFLAAYYAAAASCVVSVVTARSQLARAGPMLGMLVIRVSALLFRFQQSSGSFKGSCLHGAMELFALSGAVINVTRCPEKWVAPKGKRTSGIFDYWLNSHQIMHVLVLTSLIFKFLAIHEDYTYAYSQRTPCSLAIPVAKYDI